MVRVSPEGQFSDYTYQAKRQPLANPLLRYNAVLFSALPAKGKCFHLSFRVILFITTSAIFYPLFSMMALLGLPFTKKVTLVLPGPEKPTPFGVSASTSSRSDSGKNSPRSGDSGTSSSHHSDSTVLAQKKVYTAADWQVKLNNCFEHALDELKPALNFDYCRQFCCLFKLTVSNLEEYSDALLLKPAPSARRLIKEDCISRIQDISEALQKLETLTICEKKTLVLSAVLLVEKEDKRYQWFDFAFEMLTCKNKKHFYSLEKRDFQEIGKVKRLMEEFSPTRKLILDNKGFLKKQQDQLAAAIAT